MHMFHRHTNTHTYIRSWGVLAQSLQHTQTHSRIHIHTVAGACLLRVYNIHDTRDILSKHSTHIFSISQSLVSFKTHFKTPSIKIHRVCSVFWDTHCVSGVFQNTTHTACVVDWNTLHIHFLDLAEPILWRLGWRQDCFVNESWNLWWCVMEDDTKYPNDETLLIDHLVMRDAQETKYGVATISRLMTIICLFCKRAP